MASAAVDAGSAIEVRNVRKRFGSQEVLKGNDLRMEPGQVGASGSGQSTSSRCMNGPEAIDNGEAIVDNALARRGS
jgi:polar amino acid transport system ATP-binding protein